MAIDSGGNVSDLVAARNCCIARIDCFPEKLRLCRNEQVCQGGKNVYSALGGPTDWILRNIKTTFFNIAWVCTQSDTFSSSTNATQSGRAYVVFTALLSKLVYGMYVICRRIAYLLLNIACSLG